MGGHAVLVQPVVRMPVHFQSHGAPLAGQTAGLARQLLVHVPRQEGDWRGYVACIQQAQVHLQVGNESSELCT